MVTSLQRGKSAERCKLLRSNLCRKKRDHGLTWTDSDGLLINFNQTDGYCHQNAKTDIAGGQTCPLSGSALLLSRGWNRTPLTTHRSRLPLRAREPAPSILRPALFCQSRTVHPIHLICIFNLIHDVRRAQKVLSGSPSPSFSLQWPYCLRRCTYCNFNKYISREKNESIMAECLQREAESLLKLSQVSWYGHWLHPRRTCHLPFHYTHVAHAILVLFSPRSITSVFFGGGTPSLAHPSTIAALLEAVSRQASLAGDAEVTLEVNPTPVGTSKLEDYHRAGVNRFSIGVQVKIHNV